MDGDNRFLFAEASIYEPRHYLVALGIQSPLRSRLRHAIGKLSIAKVVIRSYRNFLRSGQLRVCGIRPIYVELPCVDSVVFEDLFELRSAGGHHDIWSAFRGKLFAIEVRIIQEV